MGLHLKKKTNSILYLVFHPNLQLGTFSKSNPKVVPNLNKKKKSPIMKNMDTKGGLMIILFFLYKLRPNRI